MKIYPAIDLMKGRCVRLLRGDFESPTVYSKDPLSLAREFAEAGAKYLHIVDLDGARKGTAQQVDCIETIARQTPLQIQVGGGIRNHGQVQRLLNAGVSKIVLGTLAVKNTETTKTLLDLFGSENFTVALDFRGDKVLTHGWQEEEEERSLGSLVEQYSRWNVRHFLLTDTTRDGALTGPNGKRYQELSERYPDVEIQASGGVASLNDIKELKRLGVGAVIIGKALLEKRFTLAEALQC